MVRWLRGERRNVREPKIDVLTEAEIRVTPRGQVMLLEGAVSAFDLNVAENNRLADERVRFWKETPRAEALGKVRDIIGVPSRRKSYGNRHKIDVWLILDFQTARCGSGHDHRRLRRSKDRNKRHTGYIA
jgi:hypothetical protein